MCNSHCLLFSGLVFCGFSFVICVLIISFLFVVGICIPTLEFYKVRI